LSVLRSPALCAAALPWILATCSDPAEPLPLNGDAVLETGLLTVRGNADANQIRITYSTSGVDVERDGETARFTDPVRAIEVSADQGNDVVRYDQTVVANLQLSIDSGEGDDDVFVSSTPGGTGSEMTLAAMIDTGPGGDRLDFQYNGSGVPALNPYITLQTESQSFVPEQDDEVLVAFENGDPDRPVVVGALWTGEAPAGATAVGDTRSLELDLDFRIGSAGVGMAISGGAGPDHVDLDADYSGVTLQQGGISIDADLGDGANSLGKYIVTSATHTDVDTNIVGGNGNNTLDLESVLGGDGEQTYSLVLGDGDNETTITFGDGVRGRRPTTGVRNVTGTYRSGSGANTVTLDSEIVEPLGSDFALDFGTGQGSTFGRYKLKFPWDRPAAPGTQTAPSQIKVLLPASAESDLDLRIDVGDPDSEDPAVFGAVTATGTALRETDLQFIHRLAVPAGSAEQEEEWEIDVNGLATTVDASLVVDIPPGLERLVYLQNAVQVADGATVKVALRGAADADAVLAHLIGISGAGRFELLADGVAGNDLLAALTRDLDTAGGAAMAFDISGGDGDDVLGLDAPASIVSGGPIVHAIAAGTGTADACFAPPEVASTGCERREAIGDELLRLLESVFGQELADVWRQ
jgi:hypothetical protein